MPWLNARVVRDAPLTPLIQLSLIKITNAVIVHTTSVSIKGSSIEIVPCLMGLFVFAAACAIGELPNPASFEKIPRDTPNLIAIHTDAPAKPPEAAVDENAEFIININISGTIVILLLTIYSPPTMYMMAMVGTNFDAVFPILFIPPSITSVTNRAITKPIDILEIANSSESTCATELD